MKKIFRLIATLFVAAATSTGFVSCSDDDDDNEQGGAGSGAPSTSVGVVNPSSGLRLRKVGYMVYNYSDDGRLKSVADGNDPWIEMRYEPNQIVVTFGGDMDEDKEVYNVSYNENGYISKLIDSGSERNEDKGINYSWNETVELTYDGEGHLIKISGAGTENGEEDGYSWNETSTLSCDFSWDGGYLKNIVMSEVAKCSENGRTYEENESYVYTFEYEEDFYNKFKQYGTFVNKLAFWDAIIDLAHVGLLGNGPDYLPSKMTTNNRGYEYTDTYNYTFNEDGSLKTSNYTDFVYGTIGENFNNEESKNSGIKARSSQRRNSLRMRSINKNVESGR